MPLKTMSDRGFNRRVCCYLTDLILSLLLQEIKSQPFKALKPGGSGILCSFSAAVGSGLKKNAHVYLI